MDQNWYTRRNTVGQHQGNFQLHRFTRSENIAASFGEATFLTRTVHIGLKSCVAVYWLHGPQDIAPSPMKLLRLLEW